MFQFILSKLLGASSFPYQISSKVVLFSGLPTMVRVRFGLWSDMAIGVLHRNIFSRMTFVPVRSIQN